MSCLLIVLVRAVDIQLVQFLLALVDHLLGLVHVGVDLHDHLLVRLYLLLHLLDVELSQGDLAVNSVGMRKRGNQVEF